MAKVLVGSEAIRAGVVTRHELSRWYRRIHPGIYTDGKPDLRDRMTAAWLWSRRRAVISGVAASALHGAAWVDADVPIELIWSNTHPPNGLIVRNETVHPDEITRIAGLPVTTAARTAYDLGRHLPRSAALPRLDALMRATKFSLDDLRTIEARYPGAAGVRGLREVVPLIDFGAASPKESWLRLALIDGGLPRPATQIALAVNHRLMALDMGWEKYKVAAEYDGDHHRSNRRQYVKDQWRLRILAELGWIVIRVIAEDNVTDVIARVTKALRSRGWRPN